MQFRAILLLASYFMQNVSIFCVTGHEQYSDTDSEDDFKEKEGEEAREKYAENEVTCVHRIVRFLLVLHLNQSA